MSDFLTLFAIMTGAALVLIGVIGGIITVFTVGSLRRRIKNLEIGARLRAQNESP